MMGPVFRRFVAAPFPPRIQQQRSGTGLGLSIAQRIANQHGGLIQVRRTGRNLLHHALTHGDLTPINEQIWIVDDARFAG